MNDRGISYAGNKKLSTVTGQEEIFDTPVRTVTGEDIGVLPNINVITPLEGIFSRSVRVEGGLDNTVSSEFNGPVIFSNKITSTSEKELKVLHSSFKVMLLFPENILLELQHQFFLALLET